MNQPSRANPQIQLRSLRFIWGALLGGQILFASFALWLVQSRSADAPSLLPREISDMLFYINLFMLVILVPTAYSVRNQIYKRNWVGQAITPDGYFIGNLVLFMICEAISVKGLVVSVITATAWPTLLPALGAWVVLCVNFPTGRALENHP